MSSIVHAPAHGLVANQPFKFANVLPTNTGIDESVTYYVLAAGLTANDFAFSDSVGGAAFTLAYAITDGSIIGDDEYALIDEDALDPTSLTYDDRLDPVEDAPMVAPTTRSVLHSWPAAPGQPQNFLLAPGYKALGARWDATSVGDLMFYEFRYAPDDGTGTGPDTTQWVKHQVKTSVVYIANLNIGTLYWGQVRSVDFDGQVITSAADPTVQDYLSAPDAGYTPSISVTPSAIPEGDVAFNSVLANIVSTNSLDASTITSGLLSISTTVAATVDGLRVYAGGFLVGFWDDTGIYIGSQALDLPINPDGSIGDLTTVPWVRVNDAGISVFDGASTTLDVLNSTGLNASAITRGFTPGGANLLRNGSFELAAFNSTAPTLKTWDLTADFTGTQVSATNVTNSNAITATAGTGTY